MPAPIPIPPVAVSLDESIGRELVECWRSSGLSGAAFCRRHGIRAQRLHYWRERLGYPLRACGRPGASLPMVPGVPSSAGFVQVVMDRSAAPSAGIEVVVGQARIRVAPGFDGQLLAEVVRALSGGGASC